MGGHGRCVVHFEFRHAAIRRSRGRIDMLPLSPRVSPSSPPLSSPSLLSSPIFPPPLLTPRQSHVGTWGSKHLARRQSGHRGRGQCRRSARVVVLRVASAARTEVQQVCITLTRKFGRQIAQKTKSVPISLSPGAAVSLPSPHGSRV